MKRGTSPGSMEHGSRVTCLEWAGDDRLYSAGACQEDGRCVIRCWDADRGSQVGFFSDEQALGDAGLSDVLSLATCRFGGWVASGHARDGVRLWRVGGGLARVLVAQGDVPALRFSGDGFRLAGSQGGRGLWVWGVPDGDLQQEIAPRLRGLVTFAGNADYFACTQGERRVELYPALGKGSGESWDHMADVTSLRLSARGGRLAVGLQDGSCSLWTVQRRSPLRFVAADDLLVKARVPKAERRREVVSLALTPACDRLITGLTNGSVRIWDVVEREIVQTIDGEENDTPTVLAVSEEGQRLAIGRLSGRIELHVLKGVTRSEPGSEMI